MPAPRASNVLSGKATCALIEEKLAVDRVAVSRYADGEFLLMSEGKTSVGSGKETRDIAPLLIEAIKYPNQIVCINDPKGKTKGRWFRTHRYLSQAGGRDLYGHANWNVYDFLRGSKLLAKFFTGRVLVVGGYAEECAQHLGHITTMVAIPTARKNAYGKDKALLDRVEEESAASPYNNIILSAGKASKVLIPRLVPLNEQANVIDMGAVLNAILVPYCGMRPVKRWGMSWAKSLGKRKLSELSNKFVEQALQYNAKDDGWPDSKAEGFK